MTSSTFVFVLLLLGTGSVSLFLALSLVATKRWHGHLSEDSSFGIQKFHTDPTPRIGGVAIFGGVLAGYVWVDESHRQLLGPIILAGMPALFVGLMEDITKHIGVNARLLATIASGVLGWALTGISITSVDIPMVDTLLKLTVVSIAFTAFAVGGVANAINIVDGMNGLAAGTVIIILGSLGFLAHGAGDADLVAVCAVLAGTVVGFGLVNWPLGKIFLGDGGAYFIGFSLAWVAVLLVERNAQVLTWAVLLICCYPVLEVLYSMWRRGRRHRGVGVADRLHLHSLVKRRVYNRRLLPNASNRVRNSLTGATMWIATLTPAVLALIWAKNFVALIGSLLFYIFVYGTVYARLTQFRWVLLPRSLTRLKTKSGSTSLEEG